MPIVYVAIEITHIRGASNKRGSTYTQKEDMLVCDAWMEVSQYHICGAGHKKGVPIRGVFWTTSINARTTLPTKLQVTATKTKACYGQSCAKSLSCVD